MARFYLLVFMAVIGLLSLSLQPAAAAQLARPSTHRQISIAPDQPGPSDQQLIRRSVAEQRRDLAAAAAAAAQPPSVQDVIRSAFAPLGEGAVDWALQIAFCESTYNPNAVNSDSNAQGLFQFLPSTWVGTPYAGSSPFDPVANANAAAWLLQTYGASQWECQA